MKDSLPLLLICVLHCFVAVCGFMPMMNYRSMRLNIRPRAAGPNWNKPNRAPQHAPLPRFEDENSDVNALATLLRDRDLKIDYSDLRDVVRAAPNIEVPYVNISNLKLQEVERLYNKPIPPKVLNAEASQKACIPWQRHSKDHGSAEVQVVVANERIKYLTAHCLANKFDFSAKRSLQALVVQRRIMLNYVWRNDSREKALELAKSLGIRYSPPDRQHIREQRYKAFKNTKQGRKDGKKPGSISKPVVVEDDLFK